MQLLAHIIDCIKTQYVPPSSKCCRCQKWQYIFMLEIRSIADVVIDELLSAKAPSIF